MKPYMMNFREIMSLFPWNFATHSQFDCIIFLNHHFWWLRTADPLVILNNRHYEEHYHKWVSKDKRHGVPLPALGGALTPYVVENIQTQRLIYTQVQEKNGKENTNEDEEPEAFTRNEWV